MLVNRWFTLLTVALIAVLSSFGEAESALALGIYPPGASGHDISFPNGRNPYPQGPDGIRIVGVNGGRPFTENPHFASQYLWALDASHNGVSMPPSLYMNTSYDVRNVAPYGKSGPLDCGPDDGRCQAYNVGYQSAAYADRYAQQASGKPIPASTWWLDVETANAWSPDTALNASVIKGAIKYWQDRHVTVGVYSAPRMWKKIAGDYVPGPSVPSWVAGTGSSCDTPLFESSEVWLVQSWDGVFDVDLACEVSQAIGLSSGPVSLATPGSGTISGSTAGNFAYYTLDYPGDRSTQSVTIDFTPSDNDVGNTVFVTVVQDGNQLAVRQGSQTPTLGHLEMSFSSDSASPVVIQIANYNPAKAIDYTIRR